ncbi:hypothetical protein SJC03_117 [Bacteroides phage SJC03]|nr:hypothetical protein SJC03_117 [Bacteroides phage SJC03]
MKKRNVILAYDPGNEQTGWIVVLEDNSKLIYKNKDNNSDCYLKTIEFLNNKEFNIVKVGIEYPSSYGMLTNQTLLDTCTFCGILCQLFLQYNIKPELIFRKSIKMFLNGSVRAKDSEVNNRVREYVGEDYTIKKPNSWYWNEEVEKYGGARYANNDMYAAIAVALYLIYPHDIKIQNEKEQERNKISKEIQIIIN